MGIRRRKILKALSLFPIYGSAIYSKQSVSCTGGGAFDAPIINASSLNNYSWLEINQYLKAIYGNQTLNKEIGSSISIITPDKAEDIFRVRLEINVNEPLVNSCKRVDIFNEVYPLLYNGALPPKANAKGKKKEDSYKYLLARYHYYDTPIPVISLDYQRFDFISRIWVACTYHDKSGHESIAVNSSGLLTAQGCYRVSVLE